MENLIPNFNKVSNIKMADIIMTTDDAFSMFQIEKAMQESRL